MKGDINPQVVEDIDKDLDRQFPFHEMFAKKGGNGQQDLRDVLHAYAVYNPGDGYCQAQAPIAAVLLMHMPAEVKTVNAILLLKELIYSPNFVRYIPQYLYIQWLIVLIYCWETKG